MSNYSEKIEKFQKSYMDLGIPVTPKIHVICSHVKEFCDRQGHGLGLYSEQASESVHHDFQKTWERFKVPEGHDSFGPQLLRAVTVSTFSHCYGVFYLKQCCETVRIKKISHVKTKNDHDFYILKN